MPKVLIVENDPMLVELLQVVLNAEGLGVVTLRDTSTAAVQTTVEQSDPDCIILDGTGPRDYGAGWATAAWLRQRMPPVPTIMLTSYVHSAEEARDGVTPRSQAAGFVAVVVKPFQVAELVAAVHRAIPRIPAQPTLEALQAEIVELKAALAARDREIERLQQLAAISCPWRDQAWHRPP